MAFPAQAALWFLPFLVPLCLYVAYTDLAYMRITNPTVTAMFAVFVVLGVFLFPLNVYLWQLVLDPKDLLLKVVQHLGAHISCTLHEGGI